MRKRTARNGLLLCGALLLASACATAPAQHPFDVRRVTLYDCGLAQMEREAEVSGETTLDIRLNLAHLDDLLATLVVAAQGDVRVTGVRYPSVFTLGQARAASSFANASGDAEGLEEKNASELCRYILALGGTEGRLERATGGPLEGTVVDCALGAMETTAAGDERARDEHLLLVSPKGAMAWVALDDIREVTPTSEREGEAIHTYARHLGRAPGLGETEVRIQTAPGSSGRLVAGYVQQAPIWRMTYKVRETPSGVQLEAWGLVHNDTDETWDRTALTLVSGLPESYVMSVASPRYSERASIYVDGDTNMFPQLGAATPDSLLYEESVVRYEYGGAGFGARGYGSGAGMAMASLKSASVRVGAGRVGIGSGAEDSALLKVAPSAAEEQAEPQVEEEISTYRALERVTIPARASSMVPLMRRELPGSTFSLVTGSGVPRTCAHVRNETGLVLQYGVSSFYVDGRFRGQTEMPRTEPGEVRVLCYGEDADVEAAVQPRADSQLKAVEWSHGTLYQHLLVRTEREYTVENRAGQARRVAIHVTHAHNGRLVAPAESLPGQGRERYVTLDVAPRSESKQTVVVEEGIRRSVVPEAAYLEPLLESEALPAEARAVLARAAETCRKREAVARDSAENHNELEKAREALARKRQSLQSLPPGTASTAGANRMLEDLMATEKKIERLTERQAEFDKLFEKLGGQVTEILMTLPRPQAITLK